MHPIADPVGEIRDHLTKRHVLFGSVLQFLSCQGMINVADQVREILRNGL
jgi:hypothetical protein